MTTSLAPGQPSKTARTCAGGGIDDADGVAGAIGDDERVAVGSRCWTRYGLLADADLGDFATGFEIDDGDGVGGGVGDVCQVAVGVELDGDGLAMHGNGGGDCVVFRVDHRDGALACRTCRS